MLTLYANCFIYYGCYNRVHIFNVTALASKSDQMAQNRLLSTTTDLYLLARTCDMRKDFVKATWETNLVMLEKVPRGQGRGEMVAGGQ